MTLLVYVSSESKLYWGFNSDGTYKTSDAISGPFGKGQAPAGIYIVHRAYALGRTEGNKPYTDPIGHVWFSRLIPLFETERTGLGIHPDGNVPGTLGCIGIKGDTSILYDFLSEPRAEMRLAVV